MAEIDDDDSSNTINGTTGNDTIRGNGGDDTIDGGNGNDFVEGGEGNDSITGGRGDDTIIGGKGNDTMTAGRNSPSDTFVIRDGDGSDTITDFDPGEPDVIAFHMDEMNSFADVQARMVQDGPDTVIHFDNGDTLRLQNVNMGALTVQNFTFNTGPVCLHEGTLILTSSGWRAIELLTAGDLIVTVDAGLQPIRHVTRRSYVFRGQRDPGQPILVARGALGPDQPARDTITSPHHRILLTQRQTGQEVLAPAKALVARKGIRRMQGRKRAIYINLVLDGHHIMLANGLAVETMLLTRYSLSALSLDRGSRLGLTPTAQTVPARPLVRKDPMGHPPPLYVQTQQTA